MYLSAIHCVLSCITYSKYNYTVAVKIKFPKRSDKLVHSTLKIIPTYSQLSHLLLFFKLQWSFKVTHTLRFPPYPPLFISAQYCCSFSLTVSLLFTDISSCSMLPGLLWLVSANMSEKNRTFLTLRVSGL